MTQMNVHHVIRGKDMKNWFEQEDAENAECSLCALRALLFQNSSSALICVICGQFLIRLPFAALCPLRLFAVI
jgi:hypothetical protein